MGYRNNPLMEPEFFTPPGSKRLYKGGGGGQVYYANQDKLAGVQADIATNLYNQAMSEELPREVVELTILKRKSDNGVDPISATRIRAIACGSTGAESSCLLRTMLRRRSPSSSRHRCA